jgi:hypothetical protein
MEEHCGREYGSFENALSRSNFWANFVVMTFLQNNCTTPKKRDSSRMIMVSAFSVLYIKLVKLISLPFFHFTSQCLLLRHLLSLSTDKYCVFAHDTFDSRMKNKAMTE